MHIVDGEIYRDCLNLRETVGKLARECRNWLALCGQARTCSFDARAPLVQSLKKERKAKFVSRDTHYFWVTQQTGGDESKTVQGAGRETRERKRRQRERDRGRVDGYKREILFFSCGFGSSFGLFGFSRFRFGDGSWTFLGLVLL